MIIGKGNLNIGDKDYEINIVKNEVKEFKGLVRGNPKGE
jgi:hypothetical protein